MSRNPLPLLSRATRPRTRKRRWLRRSLLILATLALVWIVWNRFDATPSAAAVQLSQPLTRGVADADNAWLYLYGIGAAENDDPVRLGRARTEVMNRIASRSLIVVPDEADQPLMRDALPPLSPDPAVDSSGELCPAFFQINCLDWVAGHSAMLERLREANRVRLQRVPVLLALPEWDDLHTPSASLLTAETEVRTLKLYNDLLAQQVSRALDSNDAAGLAAALDQIAAVSAFWHRLAQRPPSLLSSLIANQMRARQLHLLADILDRLDAGQLVALKAPVDTILRSALPVDWNLAMRREFHEVQLTNRLMIPAAADSLRQCGKGEMESCSHIPFVLGFAPQDTMNHVAENLLEYQRELDAAPLDVERATAQLEAARQARSLDLQHPLNLIGAAIYNPVGKYVASVHRVYTDARDRGYEIEALRRSVALKRAAVAGSIAPADMAAFLASQPAELRNPFTGQPLAWDPRQGEIHFSPVTNFWKMPRLRVSYGTLPQAGVRACPRTLTLELALEQKMFTNDEAQRPYTLVSCGDGGVAFPQDTTPAAKRYAAAQILMADGKIDARVLMTNAGQVLPYEVLDAAFDGTQELWLQPFGHAAAGGRLRLRLAAEQKSLPLVTLALSGQPARNVLQDMARQGLARIDGVELASDARVWLHGDLPPYDAVQRVAAASGLHAERIAADHFVLKKQTP